MAQKVLRILVIVLAAVGLNTGSLHAQSFSGDDQPSSFLTSCLAHEADGINAYGTFQNIWSNRHYQNIRDLLHRSAFISQSVARLFETGDLAARKTSYFSSLTGTIADQHCNQASVHRSCFIDSCANSDTDSFCAEIDVTEQSTLSNFLRARMLRAFRRAIILAGRLPGRESKSVAALKDLKALSLEFKNIAPSIAFKYRCE